MAGNATILVLITMISIKVIACAKNRQNGILLKTDVVVIMHGREQMVFNYGVVIVLMIIMF